MKQNEQFKVGDIVRFKTWEELAKEFGVEGGDRIKFPDNSYITHTQYITETPKGNSKITKIVSDRIYLDDWEEADKAYYITKTIPRPESDPVNRPAHYVDGGIETIDFIEAKGLNFARGNAVKYISRAGKKNPDKEIEDLKKAAWYINHEIERLEKKL